MDLYVCARYSSVNALLVYVLSIVLGTLTDKNNSFFSSFCTTADEVVQTAQLKMSLVILISYLEKNDIFFLLSL